MSLALFTMAAMNGVVHLDRLTVAAQSAHKLMNEATALSIGMPGPSALPPPSVSAAYPVGGIGLPGAPAVVDDVSLALGRQQGELDRLAAAAEEFKGTIDAASQALADANARMIALRIAAGVDRADGVVATINVAMQEARATLQYLQDKGSDAASIATQTKAVADLQKKLDEAAKAQRIAVYDFEHSTAYKTQLQTIADEKADIAKKQEEYAAQQAKVEALKKDLDVARAGATVAATNAATELKHTTDILSTTGAATGVAINTAAGKMVAAVTHSVTLIGGAVDAAVTKIITASASIGTSTAATRSTGGLP